VSSAFATTYPQPTISSFSPSSVAKGAVITVAGKGFTGTAKAWIGNGQDAKTQVVSDTQLKITVPADATSGKIVVLNPNHSAFSSTSVSITSAAAAASTSTASDAQPSITSFSPSSGAAGSTITLKGKGFTGANAAWVGAGHDAHVAVVSDTVVTLTAPADVSSGLIVLFNPKHAAFSPTPFQLTSSASSGGSGSGSGGGSTTTTASALSVRVQGDHFIDADSEPLQLRGVNVSGLEFVAVQGWSPANPWATVAPNYTAIKTWKSNTVRLPLNEASWLGYTCVDAAGASRNPDPGHNYKATVEQTVANATAAGLYVILDLHWTAPANFCPLAQNPMADTTHSIDFWTSIADTFKGQPNVMFELFNEPYFYWLTGGETAWGVLMQGGTMTEYVTGDGNEYTKKYTWAVAGMQQMLNAVRATGATNVVLIAGVTWAQDLSQWVAHAPKDPLKQIAAVWHAYPDSGTVGSADAAIPKLGTVAYSYTQSVLTAGYPVFITEYGDHSAPGVVGAPFVSKMLPWADEHGVSYTGWAWDPWGDTDNVLITSESGTPTAGYGVYTKAHYLCVATGSSNCP
jgi:endoglucanase